jgi:hypothetical protein
MGKMKSELLSILESDFNLHDQYWLDQLLNHHYEPIGEIHEKDLPVFQHQQLTFPLNRGETIQC